MKVQCIQLRFSEVNLCVSVDILFARFERIYQKVISKENSLFIQKSIFNYHLALSFSSFIKTIEPHFKALILVTLI